MFTASSVLPSSAARVAAETAPFPWVSTILRWSNNSEWPFAAYSLGQQVEHLFQQRQRPGAVEQAVGRERIGRLEAIAILRPVRIDRNGRRPTAPSSHSTELVDQEVLAIGAQERTESALARIRSRDVAFFEQAREKLLRQVEGLIMSVALSPDERVDRIPVSGAELGQGRAGLG